MHFDNFPPEILLHIFRFLPGSDIQSCSRTCKWFQKTSQIDRVWKTRCRVEFGVEQDPESPLSHYDVYTRVLYQNGYLLGLWQPNIGPYGGLIHIKFNKRESVIHATELQGPIPTQGITAPLRRRALFSISFSSETGTVITCQRGHTGNHQCKIIKSSKEEFFYDCDGSHEHPRGKQAAFDEWRHDNEMGLWQEPNLCIMFYKLLVEHSYKFTANRILLPQPISPHSVIELGMFKGNYGGHGVEIIMLQYNKDQGILEGLKISGDPNVKAGVITLRADLRRPMILTKQQQQQSIALLENIDIPDLPPDLPLQKIPPQPFILPGDCYQRDGEIPKLCKIRLHGEGQIADHGYLNPQFIRGHFVVFDNDLFGFIWLKLRSFCLFSRCTEDFDAICD